jgi:glutaminase
MTVNTELARSMAQLAIFRDLSSSELASLAQTLDEVTFREGAFVFRQGEENASLYIVVEGEATVVINDEQRGLLGRGAVFGEISALLAESTTADVWARTPLRCVVVKAADVEGFLVSNPRVMFRVLQAEARRLRGADQHRT